MPAMNAPRPKLGLKTGAPLRDPKRRAVRPGAPKSPTDAAPRPAHPTPPPLPPSRQAPKPRREPAARPGGPAPSTTPPATASTTARPAKPTASPALPRDAATEGVRLSKQLSDSGTASRREADEWIAAGWVRVDGQVAVLGQRVLPHQRIDIDPAARSQQSRSVTILLHKPIGYVSGQAEDGYQPAATLVTPANHWPGDTARIEFHRGHLRGLAPAGRLDIDSTGLLVLTQDGRVARHLIGDDSKVEKEYLVRVAPLVPGGVRDDALALLNHGLSLDDKPLKPAKVSWQNEDQLRFVLREGRKRQIRRMCELVGFKVLGLKRVRIGSVVLGKLPPGQWRYLGEHERF